ncbi:MAG: hypothetical protein Fur002_19590 [Anaerolineales bacterium]
MLNLRRNLGLQLLLFYLLLILPFLAALVVFDQFVGRRIRHDVEANDLALARAIALETDISVNNALESVRGLSHYQSVIALETDSMTRVFQVAASARPDVNLVYRLDENGVMFFHYPIGPNSTVGVDFSFRSYFQNARNSSAPLISEGRISPTTEQAVATAVMPIRAGDGKFLGLVGANIKLESLSQTLSAISEEHADEPGFEILILDSAGQVIAHPNAKMLLRPAAELFPQIYEDALKGKSGSVIAKDLQGEERLYTYAAISTAGWGVVISRPTAVAFATQMVLERVTQIAAATFLLIGLAFWGILSLRVLRPIERLAPISEAIGMNQTIAPSQRANILHMAKRLDQIGHLIRSILRMEDSIHARMQEQETLLETSATVVSSLDLNTVLNRIIEQAGRLLSAPKIAVIALDEARGEFRIRASRGLSQRFTEQLFIQPSEPNSVSMRALRAHEPVQVSDTETDPSYVSQRPRARAEGYRSILAAPLNTQHAPPTALLLFRPDPHEFTPREINLLTTFANQATMAIENAILFERSDVRLQEQTSRLEALVESMEDGLILSDLRGNVIYANRRIADLANLASEDLAAVQAERVMQRIFKKSAEEKSAELTPLLNGALPVMELSLVNEKGLSVQLRIQSFDVTDRRKTLLGRGLLLHDVTLDRELDRMKSNLISTVSHELRTPLASIKGYASTLLAEDVQWDAKSQREFIMVISQETDRLTNLVNNLLDLSRIEAGSLRLSLEQCRAEDAIAHAAQQARLPAAQLSVNIGNNAKTLQADSMRLETILRNLFENALKYGGENVRVRVNTSREGDAIFFRVADDGPGIPSDQSEKIFERFYRLDESLTRTTSGAGLGLAICQGLARAHNGEIWVEPNEGGACIAFYIPLKNL